MKALFKYPWEGHDPSAVCVVVGPGGWALSTFYEVSCQHNVNGSCSCTKVQMNEGIRKLFRGVEEESIVLPIPLQGTYDKPDRNKVSEGMWAATDAQGLTEANETCYITTAALGIVSSKKPETLHCPPGMYCEGGNESPKFCGKGDFCPVNAGKHHPCPSGFYCPTPRRKIMCPAGTHCGEGRYVPWTCSSGRHCPGGSEQLLCPRGYYCPRGASTPIKCSRLVMCEEGSAYPNAIGIHVACLIVAVCAMVCGKKIYTTVLRSHLWVWLGSALGLAMCWVVAPLIGAFLTFYAMVLLCSWGALHWCAPPSWMSSQAFELCVSLGSVVLGVVALFIYHRPFAVIIAMLIGLIAMAWSMGRIRQVGSIIGHILLGLGTAALLSLLGLRDPKLFVPLVLVFMVSLAITTTIEMRYRLKHEPEDETSEDGHSSWLPSFMSSRSSREGANQVKGEEGGEAELVIEMTSSFVQKDLMQQEQRRQKELEQQQQQPQSRKLSVKWPLAASSSEQDDNEHAQNDDEDPVWADRGPSASQAQEQTKEVSVEDPESCPKPQPSAGVSFQLQGLSYELANGQKLLQNLNLSVGSGRSVAVMGPSGCGKSTLVSVLSGRATCGKIRGKFVVNGVPDLDPRFFRRVVGFVPQDDILHGDLSVEENLHFQAMLRLHPSKARQPFVSQKVHEVATGLGLAELLQQRVGTAESRGLSGGQRKRVSIGMELVIEPALLFADEPTTGLDSTTSKEVTVCLTQGTGVTTLAIIHQPRFDMLKLFDDLLLLGKGGILVYSGSTTEVVEHFEKRLGVAFPLSANPADVLMDVVNAADTENLMAYAKICELRSGKQVIPRSWGTSIYAAGVAQRDLRGLRRTPHTHIQAVLAFTDRTLRATYFSLTELVLSQFLLFVSISLLAFGARSTAKDPNLDGIIAGYGTCVLLFMLLLIIKASHVFQDDHLITRKESDLGVPMSALFMAKDLVGLIEVSASALTFCGAFSTFMKLHLSFRRLLGSAWCFSYAVSGLAYIISMLVPAGSSQTAAILQTAFCYVLAGVQPTLPEIARLLRGRGWLLLAVSPVRWMMGYLLTEEALIVSGSRGLPDESLDKLGYCIENLKGIGSKTSMARGMTLESREIVFRKAWRNCDGWVYSPDYMLMLGLIFRCFGCYIFLKKYSPDNDRFRSELGRPLRMLYTTAEVAALGAVALATVSFMA